MDRIAAFGAVLSSHEKCAPTRSRARHDALPECNLLAAMRRAERVVDIERPPARLAFPRAELIKQSFRQSPRRGLARAFSGREMVDYEFSDAPVCP
jgi:hypothetical protein